MRSLAKMTMTSHDKDFIFADFNKNEEKSALNKENLEEDMIK